MHNKKNILIAIIIIIVIAILFGLYKVFSGYLFDKKTGLSDSKTELVQHLKQIEKADERKNQINFSLEHNLITKNEANELY